MGGSFDNFVATLRHSCLLDKREVDSALQEFQSNSVTTGNVDQLVEFLIARGSITAWQADKLKHEQYKGFYLGDYMLLDRIDSGNDSNRYLARHLPSSRNVALRIYHPRSRAELSMPIRYELEELQ